MTDISETEENMEGKKVYENSRKCPRTADHVFLNLKSLQSTICPSFLACLENANSFQHNLHVRRQFGHNAHFTFCLCLCLREIRGACNCTQWNEAT